MNVLNPAQFPHSLQVKLGAPIVILRNLRSVGVSNGQRGILASVSPNKRIISLELYNKPGYYIELPRIDFPIPLPGLQNKTFRRRQFPIRLAFAMTIHKAQGQTLDRVVVDLTHPLNPLSPGQL